MKFDRNGDPVVPARYDDPLSRSIYYNGKAYSTTPARATDEEIEDDLAQMRKTWDGKPYVKPASPKEVLPEFDDYGYKGRIIKKPKSKLESNIRNEPPTGEELANGSQPKGEEAGVPIETSDIRDEPLNTNERFWGCKFRGGEEESSVTMSDTRYKTFLGEEVFQPNQAPGEEAESSFAKPNAPRVPFMKKVVQDSQFKAKEPEPLLEACNARDEPLAMKEVFEDNQPKDKEVESSVAPDTPTTLALINCAVDTGAPATSRKRKISEISELTSGPLTSPLDGQMPQTENEEGPPHKKLRTANGAVNLPIPPEKPATPKKAIPARAKRTATRKTRCAGSGRVRKTARVGKASSVVDKSVAKAAPPAIPAAAKTLAANTEEPAGEPAIVSKSVAVVVITRASSTGIVKKDKSPTVTSPEAEDPIREIVTDKSSTSSESGDDLEKDESYAPRRRRVARKGKAPVAPRKRAAPNKAITSNEEKTTAQQGYKPSAAIPEVITDPEIASTKPIAVSRNHGVKRKATGLEDEIAVQQEAELPVAPGADAALITESPAPVPPGRCVRRNATAPKDAIIKPRTTPEVDTALATETDKPAPRPRKRARKEVNIPEDGAIVQEWVQLLTCPEADAVQKTQRPSRVPTRRPRRRNDTAPEELITRTTTPAEIGTALAKENPKPAAGPKESGRRNGKAPEAEATAQKEAGPLAAPGVDAALITENPAPAPPRRYVKRKATAPEEAIIGVTTTPAEISTTLTKENAKPAAGPKRRGRRNGNAPEAEATAQKEAGPPATPDVDAALATEKPTPAPPRRYVRRKATAPEEEITGATTTPAEIDTTLTKENAKPAAGSKRRGRRNGNAPEATAQKEAGPPAAPDVDAALTTEKPTPALPGGYAKRKATVPEAATGPPIVPKVSTTLAEIANTSQRWRRNVGAHTVKVVTHPDTSLKIDNTKQSAATKSRGVKRKATQLEDKAANRQDTEPSPTPVINTSPATKITKLAPTPERSMGETITALQDITTTLLNTPKADAALAQGSDESAAGPREHKKRRVDTPEVGAAVPQEAGPPAAPEVDPTLTAEKEAAAPATTSAPPVRVRGPRYRIPAEGSRKSTRIKAQHDKLK